MPAQPISRETAREGGGYQAKVSLDLVRAFHFWMSSDNGGPVCCFLVLLTWGHDHAVSSTSRSKMAEGSGADGCMTQGQLQLLKAIG